MSRISLILYGDKLSDSRVGGPSKVLKENRCFRKSELVSFQDWNLFSKLIVCF